MKMKYLKTMLTGEAQAALECMGYNACFDKIAWDFLASDFGRPEIVVNEKLKRLNSYSLIQPDDTTEVIKYSHNVSSCVNLPRQYGYESDLTSESVSNNAVT